MIQGYPLIQTPSPKQKYLKKSVDIIMEYIHLGEFTKKNIICLLFYLVIQLDIHNFGGKTYEKNTKQSQFFTHISLPLLYPIPDVWMDGVTRLEDGCPQVPGTTCYQDNVLFIVVLQGSTATALSLSDLSIIQPTHEGTASGLQV